MNEDFFEWTTNDEGRLVIDGHVIYQLHDDPDWYTMKADNELERGNERMAKIFRSVAHGLQKDRDAKIARQERRMEFDRDPAGAFMTLSNRVAELEKRLN